MKHIINYIIIIIMPLRLLIPHINNKELLSLSLLFNVNPFFLISWLERGIFNYANQLCMELTELIMRKIQVFSL
jgi:hypothetical protein